MAKAKRKILRGFAIALGAILALVLLFFAAVAIAESVCIQYARTLPSYEKIDISSLLSKEEWTAEDYDTLYHQTGLGKSALDSLKGNNEKILEFQEALFYDGEVIQNEMAPTTKHDKMDGFFAPLAPLETGDVVVTSTCHTAGWRNGHAALVVDGKKGHILESYTLGDPSGLSNMEWFRKSANFIVLRLKDHTAEERAEIAKWAMDHLTDVKYSITVGVFSPKDQGEDPKETHCSHLVWQAYYHFGYDIDSDGGMICTTNDIANSPLFEVVQVYGFDPDKLWK